MEIREAREGEVVVLSPEGSLAGTEDTSALESKLAAVQKAGARLLVIDCSRVGQLTSVAIRALLLTSRKLARSQGRLALCGMNPKVRKAFAISGFDKDFTISDSREEALRQVVEPLASPAAAARRAQRLPSTPADEPPPPAVPSPAAAAEATPEPPPSASGESAPAAAPQLPAAPAPAGPPAPDPRELMASALLDALGVRMSRPVAAGTRGAMSNDLETIADVLLAALRAGR